MNIEKYILNQIKKQGRITSAQAINHSGFSRAYVNRFFKALCQEKRISLIGRANTAHYLKYNPNLIQKTKQKKSNINKGFIQSIKDVIDIPVLGTADCGEPLSFADDYIEDHIQISKKFIKGNKDDYFFVRAQGDSMNKEGIKDKNYVLIKRSQNLSGNGENILAVVNGLGTIKKFYRQKDAILLSPNSTNLHHQPIVLHPEEDIFICGQVKQVFNFI
ncbi:S24 family peptidase [bacterium]|nr:S24 family peptidase [bacterium]